MDLLGVIVGGALALAGSIVTAIIQFRGAAAAARRDQAEGVRAELSEFVVDALDLLDRLEADGLSPSVRTPDQLDRQNQAFEKREQRLRSEARRLIVALPLDDAPGVLTQLRDVPRSVQQARINVDRWAIEYSLQGKSPGEANVDQAQQGVDVARDAVEELARVARAELGDHGSRKHL